MSGCFSPFPHGTSSLSVRHEYLGLEGVPPIFRQNFTCSALLNMSVLPAGTGLSPAMAILSRMFPFVHTDRLVPFRSPLLWESRLISFPPGTEMFQFPGLASTHLCIQCGMVGHDPDRVSPFGSPRIKARLAAPRGLSQLATSFIDFQCQGIHRKPLVA